MRKLGWVLIVFAALAFASCTKSDTAAGPHATVFMRDGSQVTGTVTSSSASEITVRGDDNTTKTIAMKDVKSIEYDEAGAGAAPAASTEPAKTAAGRRSRQSGNRQVPVRPEESAITTKTYELPAGTELQVRVEETIDSARATKGQTFAADIVDDVRDAAGDVVIPDGANAQVVILDASAGGRVRGTSELALDLYSVSVGGRQYRLSTVDLVQGGKSGIGANKRTATFTGGGAAIGAIIGAIAGQGKGAAIGAGSGAAAGALTQIVTKGGSIKVPVETVLKFKLDKPLRVVAAN